MNAFYAQSGGVTAVINATACGVIETARKHRNKIANVYAGRNGIIGALTEDMIDTNKESASTIAALMTTPGGAFGSARYKLRSLEENKAEYERLIEVFRAHDIGYFFYNGGNDSMDTAHKVSQISKRMGFPVTCLGVPKTVDNDLPITDCCPGFGSVAKYVAVSTKEAALDVLSMAKTSTKVFILEVMGRHAGWIAAAGGLAGKNPEDAPHIILFPEVPFNKRAFLKKVKDCVKKYEYCVIVVSEGASYANGKFLAEAGTRDAPSLVASPRLLLAWCATTSASSTTTPLLTTYSARHGISPRRPTSNKPTRSANRPCSSRCRARRRSCPSSSEYPTSPIAGRSSRRRCPGLPTRKRCCRSAISVPTASGSPRRHAAIWSR
jgi:6-phosphofructokinase